MPQWMPEISDEWITDQIMPILKRFGDNAVCVFLIASADDGGTHLRAISNAPKDVADAVCELFIEDTKDGSPLERAN